MLPTLVRKRVACALVVTNAFIMLNICAWSTESLQSRPMHKTRRPMAGRPSLAMIAFVSNSTNIASQSMRQPTGTDLDSSKSRFAFISPLSAAAASNTDRS